MAFALIDHQVHGHTRVQYIVCVNFIALTFAVGLEAEDQTPSIQERLKTLQDGYRRNAFTALRHVSILDPPSLPLLQTLLSGVSQASFPLQSKFLQLQLAYRTCLGNPLPDGW